MAVRPVRRLGDPILRSECEPIQHPQSAAIRIVADDLQETLRDLRQRHGMGRGLTAPQIGAPLRLIYIETSQPSFLINPEIVEIGTEDFLVWDDCFSIPHLLVRVQRAYRIEVSYQDLSGRIHTLDAEGPIAELLQHEIDHLEGVLTVDRATGLDPFCVSEEWNKNYAVEGRYSKPTPRTVSPDLLMSVSVE